MKLDNEHGKVEALLPWYANGTLEGEELRRVASHLEGCAHCREELKFLGDVRAVLRISAAAEQPAPVLRNAGFGSLPPDLQARVLSAPRVTLPQRRWIPALAASFLAAVGLGVALTIAWLEAPRFQTATQGAVATRADSALVAVRFVPDAPLGELNNLLREHDAVIVRGPGATDEWLLEMPVADGGVEALLPELRGATGVASAEAVKITNGAQ